MDEIRGQAVYRGSGNLVCFKILEPGTDITEEDITDLAHRFLINYVGDFPFVESHVAPVDYPEYGVKKGAWLVMAQVPSYTQKDLFGPALEDFFLQIRIGRRDES